MTERYRPERHAGTWRVVDTTDGQVVGSYGAGSAGAVAAADAARALEHRAVQAMSPIRVWRKGHRLSQTRLAELLGVTLLTVHRWEVGIQHAPAYIHLALRELDRQLTTAAQTEPTPSP
jgi:DNA-binding transcriptional regulator YiaG